MVAKIATVEIEETTQDGKNTATVALGRKDGKSRAEKLTTEQRSEIAKKVAAKRWSKR